MYSCRIDRSWPNCLYFVILAVLLILVCSRNRVASCCVAPPRTIDYCTLLRCVTVTVWYYTLSHICTHLSISLSINTQLLVLLIPVLDSIHLFLVHAYRTWVFNFVLILFPANLYHAPHPRQQSLVDAMCYMDCNQTLVCAPQVDLVIASLVFILRVTMAAQNVPLPPDASVETLMAHSSQEQIAVNRDQLDQLAKVPHLLRTQNAQTAIVKYNGEPTVFREWIRSLEKYSLLIGSPDAGGSLKALALQSAEGPVSDFLVRYYKHNTAYMGRNIKGVKGPIRRQSRQPIWLTGFKNFQTTSRRDSSDLCWATAWTGRASMAWGVFIDPSDPEANSWYLYEWAARTI